MYAGKHKLLDTYWSGKADMVKVQIDAQQYTNKFTGGLWPDFGSPGAGPLNECMFSFFFFFFTR